MSKNKNNSIIFLTTLSVYLGLVLVGGAMSPVLAQAATTRNFNVQDEIEVRDDLDKKPDDESIEVSSAKEFPILFIQLLSEIRAEIESGKYSASVQPEFTFSTSCFQTGWRGSGRSGTSITDLNLHDFVADAVAEKFQPSISEVSDTVAGSVKGWKLYVEANKTDLLFKASFTKSNAELFADSLNKAFLSSVIQSKEIQITQIYESSKATFKDNQVFIVIRLPRGSLDNLFKQDAKAEK